RRRGWKGVGTNMAKNSASFYETYSDDLLTYNARDCVYTANIYAAMLKEPRWKEPRTKKLYLVHIQLSRLAARMHTHGMYVLERVRQRLIRGYERECEVAEAKFLALCGIPKMRCTPDDLRSLIYKRHESQRITRFSLP